MNSTDLAGQFSRFVKGYEVGTDDVVYKFVGKHIENSGGVEAELDIQFIMGPVRTDRPSLGSQLQCLSHLAHTKP